MKCILEQGGNAVDSAIAGIIATTASLPILASLTGVGYLMIGTPEGDFYIDAMGTHPTTNLDREHPQ